MNSEFNYSFLENDNVQQVVCTFMNDIVTYIERWN